MSIKQMAKVWELHLHHAERLVLLALADHAHDDGTNTRPSLGFVGWKTGYALSSVKRIVASLRKTGLIQVTREGGGRYATVYRLCLEAGKTKSPYKLLSAEIDPAQNETGITGGTATVSRVTPQPLDKPSATTKKDLKKEKRVATASLRAAFASSGFEVPAPLLDLWTTAYPAVHVAGEILRAHAWAVAHPENRKKNWTGFLQRWLAREQEHAPAVRRNGRDQTLAERSAELTAGFYEEQARQRGAR